jgi:hypothetical protein
MNIFAWVKNTWAAWREPFDIDDDTYPDFGDRLPSGFGTPDTRPISDRGALDLDPEYTGGPTL